MTEVCLRHNPTPTSTVQGTPKLRSRTQTKMYMEQRKQDWWCRVLTLASELGPQESLTSPCSLFSTNEHAWFPNGKGETKENQLT